MPSNPVRPLSYFEIKVPKTSETSSEAMATFFATLPTIKNSFFKRLISQQSALSFEIVVWNQQIHFMTAIPTKHATYFNSQFIAQYPRALIEPVSDYMPYLFIRNTNINQKLKLCDLAQLRLSKAFYLPLKTYQDFSDVDPLSTILGALAKADPQDKIVIQFLINQAAKRWQTKAWSIANKDIPTSDPEKVIKNPLKPFIEKKISQTGFNVQINLLTIANNTIQATKSLQQVAGSFASVTHPEANHLQLKNPYSFQKQKLLTSIFYRKPIGLFSQHILTTHELATLYHLPNQNLKAIKNIAWGGTLDGEAPENLPTASSLTPEEKAKTNFYARTEFKNQMTVYGIKKNDRRKHIYIIGKTGVGKSTLIANMAINDMRNGEGLAVIDPHGDLCETILNYVPKNRINDIVYLDPTNTDMPFRMNPLEVDEIEQADLVASGIVAIFHKLFAYSWGPRLEYILRNTLLTLCQAQGTTLLDVPRILTNHSYRNKITDKLKDPVLTKFWKNEFNVLEDRDRNQAISPILNKVGQFITSPKIRLILERPHSSINLQEIMDTGKILILNLSQGKIGEDNAALLGAMFITKIQLAAMNRVHIPEDQRKDFYLYVDEFQNFATSSFIKILSEARKYRLNLTVANQYTAQVETDVQKAIFGNIGTLISFLVGAEDAHMLNDEFGKTYEESDLVHLNNFEIINKVSIDNRTSNPFPAVTLPLPKNSNQNRDKVIKVSTQRYGKANKSKSQKEQPKQSPTERKDETENNSLSESDFLKSQSDNSSNHHKSKKDSFDPKRKNDPKHNQAQQAQQAMDKLANLGVLQDNNQKPSNQNSSKKNKSYQHNSKKKSVYQSHPKNNKSNQRPRLQVTIED